MSLTPSLVELAHKPGASLSYTFVPGKNSSGLPLIVFVNGLMAPAASWIAVISLLTSRDSYPAMLAYDRYGQGATTDRDPVDAKAADPKHGHDCLESVKDLHQLITQINHEKDLRLDVSGTGSGPGVFLVCNSIGGALSRLYAQTHPHTVSSILFLDSVVANTDFVSIYPDPDAPDFKERYLPLPEGVTEDGLRVARQKMQMIFHPDNPSAEGLSRKNLRDLLPDADKPALVGSGGNGPWITVVGHGFQAFAEEGLKGLGIPPPVTMNYGNTSWHEYNKGLAKLTVPERSKGPILAEKCGHFIQKDDPEFVAMEIIELLDKMSP
ncbi:Alpha/Beta hydrolase protein [Xylogone sp. PMI_703]|nr:Alpha/Beta hydrolase protein [Xylogone sp. PMI_703]